MTLFVDKDINLVIDLIGYKSKGESIVLRLQDKALKYCAVFDCYTRNGINKTLDILERNNVNKIDLLCWTHPDEDHTSGLEELIKEFTSAGKSISILAIPQGFSQKEISPHFNPELSKSFQEIFELINKNNADNKFELVEVNHRTSALSKLNLRVGIEDYQFIIQPFSPISGIVRDFCAKNLKKTIQKFKEESILKVDEKSNIFSIGVFIQFGNRKICLMSDVINKTIENIDASYCNYYFNNLSFLKIAHHGSSTSDYFFNHLTTNIEISGVTAHIQHKLPEPKILSDYNNKSNYLYCTSNLNDIESQINDYGILSLNIPLEQESNIEISTEGNATCLTR